MKDDLINRQAAIDALGERPLAWRDDDDYALGEGNQYDADVLALETVPSARSEIIRCGKCTHKDKEIDYCHYLGITICESDYCSYAKRRTDE